MSKLKQIQIGDKKEKGKGTESKPNLRFEIQRFCIKMWSIIELSFLSVSH